MNQIINLRERPEWASRAADYFSSRWNIDRRLYADSITDSLTTGRPVPRWYLLLRGEDIPGGFGLIENDFMVRTDLCPWLCALYIEPSERGHALGAKLLHHGQLEAARLGYESLYLNTDHVGYYERYGWRYMGNFAHQSGEDTRVYAAEAICDQAAELKIETSRLVLRPFTESDAAAVKHFTENEFETEAKALEWILWIRKRPGKRPGTNKTLIMFAVEVKQTGECIGRVYIHSKVELNDEVEIGYCISKEHRNKGFATEAAKAAVWFAFERAAQDVLSAIVKPENIASTCDRKTWICLRRNQNSFRR